MPKSSHLPSRAPADAPGAGGGPSSTETAQYIEEMAGELADLARRSNLDLLAYLLDMAKLEARKNSGRLTARR
jgi:hypothetical protein